MVEFIAVNAKPSGELPALGSDPNNGAQSPQFEWRVRVYYEDTDAGGIVYYANYLRFFERARTEWLRSLGVNQRELSTNDALEFIVRSMSIDYRRPARLDDELMLTLQITRVRGASLEINQQARLVDSPELLVGASVRVASVHRDTGRPTGLPNWLATRVLS